MTTDKTEAPSHAHAAEAVGSPAERLVGRLAPERAMSGLVFTADRAGEVQADMNTLREYSKTPNTGAEL